MSAIEQPEETTSDGLVDMAAQLALMLAHSTPMPMRPQDEHLLDGLEGFRFGPDKSRLAWSAGKGPLVLMVHGYGGRGVQMAGLARFLSEQGYRSVFFDAGGHGDSRPERVGFHTFINDVRDLTRAVDEPVHAWIGHSAGGLAMMRARKLYRVHAERYVCISTPLYPYVPLDSFRMQAGADEETLQFVKPILAEQFQTTWTGLTAGESYLPEDDAELLAIYDRDDKKVHHEDADRLAELWPGASVMKTDTYGHNRILQAPEVWERVGLFLRPTH